MTKNPFGKTSNLIRHISIESKEMGGVRRVGKWIRSMYDVLEIYVYIKTMSAPRKSS